MRDVGRGTTDQALALNTNLLPCATQRQQGSATIVPFCTQLRPRSVPSEEEACLALRRCDLLSRHLARELAPTSRRSAVPTRERDVEPLMSCDKVGRP